MSVCLGIFVFMLRKKKKKGTERTNAMLSEENTHLELQHVTAVVTDLNTKCVDVWRIWPSTAPLQIVPNDIDCHALRGFCGILYRIAMIFGIDAMWNMFFTGWLNSDRKQSVSDFCVFFQVV